MTIAQVSKEYGLSADTLRYYEKIGLIPPVPRNFGGNRDYDESSCKWIEFVKCMRGAGLPVDTLVRYVQLFAQGDETIEERKAILREQRDRIAAEVEEKQKVLARLNGKLDVYEELLLRKERELEQEAGR